MTDAGGSVPQGDPSTQAIASLRGYAYQLYASAVTWVSLSPDDELYLEVAEDYAVAARQVLDAVQVKDTEAKVTLNSENARAALDHFVGLVEANPGRRVSLRFLSTAGITTEQRLDHRVGTEPSLVYWDRAAKGAEIEPLRRVLRRLDLTDRVRKFIDQRDDSALGEELIQRISWDCGAPQLAPLRETLEQALVFYGAEHLQVPVDEARRLTGVVLEHVLRTVVHPAPANRKLTSANLLTIVDAASRVSLRRRDLDTLLHKTALILDAETSPPNRPPSAALEQAGADLARDALERDFSNRFRRAMQASVFPENQKRDLFRPLADQLLGGDVLSISPSLRRRVLLRAVRSSALRKDLPAAEAFLAAAQSLEGPESDAPAAARLSEARGDVDRAFQVLRDAQDADSRSTLFSVIARSRGDKEAISWFRAQGTTIHELTANGAMEVANAHLRLDDVDAAKAVLDDLAQEHVETLPYLLMLRGAVRFAALLPRPERQLPLHGLQLDVRRVRPIYPDAVVAAQLDAATHDFQRLAPSLNELGLSQAARLVADYLVWFDLLHPARAAAALVQLRADMETPGTALSRIQFALAYDDTFDPSPISRYLESREAFGGLNDDELRAAFLILLHGDQPAPVAALITKHRAQLDASFGKAGIRLIEIQALARAGDPTAARAVLEENKGSYEPEEIARLTATIVTAEGGDPVAEHRRAFEAAKTPESLRALIAVLSQREDYRAIGPYAEQLFTMTSDRRDLAYAAYAFARAQDDANLARLVEAHPDVLDRDRNVARYYGWMLFHRGRYQDARPVIDKLRQTPQSRDLDLEIAIAIETGEWEMLTEPLTASLQLADQLSALTLIRAAHLAQASGQGPVMDLTAAALRRGSDDPHVLLGAYMLYVEEGLDDRDEPHEWFRRALDLSGADGPVRAFELKDLLEKQIEWNEHSRKISEGISRGDIPLVVAAHGLRTTVVDIVLRNLTRNAHLSDARRKVCVPLFSGRRAPLPIGPVRRIALDFSSMLILGWLGLLPSTLDTFAEIVLPAATFRELFEGRRRIREYQKSRLLRAEHISRAIARGKLRVVRSSQLTRDPLVEEVGDELAALLRAAESEKGVVLRPPPVRRPGVAENRDADLSEHAGRLADMHTLVAVLRDNGAIDATQEDTARRYFTLQDKGWPSSARPDVDRPLYLDGLSVTYLQTVGLLDIVLGTFSQVYVHGSTEEEASALIEHDTHVIEVLRVIDAIRDSIRKAQAANKIVFGPRRLKAQDDSEREEDQGEEVFESPTLNLVSDLMKSDVAIVDDRALNKEPFAVDRTQHRSHTATTLDVIEELLQRGVISENDRRAYRHRLRTAGAALMPVDVSELTAAARRSGEVESAELRAIREAILLPRSADMPRFPAEIPWFAHVVIAMKNAVMELWKQEADRKRAARLSELMLSLELTPETWIAQWDGQDPPNWSEAMHIAVLGGLALPIEIDDPNTLKAYHAWLEDRVLGPLRLTSAGTYSALVSHIQSFITSFVENADA
jgi:hypothetical protein